jgi:uroporphyrin-III C-methyltransferase / precorrin-2 dehydrogenase / sirohydrochlorin ferrochelatase
MRYLPVCLDLKGALVVLVGAGEPALNKLRLLRAAGARVRWFPLDVDVAEEIAFAGPGGAPLGLRSAA